MSKSKNLFGGQTKFWEEEKLGPKKNVAQKKIKVQKDFVPKKIGYKKMLVEENIWVHSKKIFG